MSISSSIPSLNLPRPKTLPKPPPPSEKTHNPRPRFRRRRQMGRDVASGDGGLRPRRTQGEGPGGRRPPRRDPRPVPAEGRGDPVPEGLERVGGGGAGGEAPPLGGHRRRPQFLDRPLRQEQLLPPYPGPCHTALSKVCSCSSSWGQVKKGSTAAALHAGTPQVFFSLTEHLYIEQISTCLMDPLDVSCIVCPFLLDQFYWAERLFWLGVAPEPLQKDHLVPDSEDARSLKQAAVALSAAIKHALSPEIRDQAS